MREKLLELITNRDNKIFGPQDITRAPNTRSFGDVLDIFLTKKFDRFELDVCFTMDLDHFPVIMTLEEFVKQNEYKPILWVKHYFEMERVAC